MIDRRRDSAEAGKSLLFACSQGADFDALLAEFDPAETDIVLPLASAPPSPAFEYIRVAQDDLPSWAGELVAGKHEDLVQTLSARKYDRVIIPWRYPETWRDNALEAAAARICDYVEVRHAGGGQRGFYGENLHRLLYNKAYLASMFASVPQPAGLDVLEVGCSDGMVCDIFALLGAKRIVGIDVMESVGCSYRNPAIEYHSMQADALSFPDKSFDLVYSIATLEHVPHPSRVLEEIVRVLKPGGYAYVQAAPLYHSPFGHHMFAYFGDQPWIHLRRTKAQILDYARAHGIEARVRRDFGISLETYLDEMLNFDHVNGLLLDQYGLDAFQARADVEIIKFNRSYEGANLLSSAIVEEIPHIERERLIEHGFELAFRRR